MTGSTRAHRHARTISHSEVSALLACPARWDFQYGDRLAGSSLERRAFAPTPGRGRLWGATLQAWHAGADAHAALTAEIDAALAEAGPERAALEPALAVMRDEVTALLEHYVDVEATAWPQIELQQREREILIPIPALNGHGRSSRWRLHGYIDGIADLAGRLYIVEYKLRHQLGRLDIITLGRQVRWYAWALREEGIPVAGVIYDERLNAAPKAPRVLKNGKASHDRHQMTTAARYASLCRQLGGEPQADVANALAERRWQARHLLEFTSRELDEAGLELRDAAGLVAAADRMAQPLRNASARTCPGCQFLDACPDPGDASLVDALYDRRPAKRDRQQGD